jgi:diaminohydroxyphosphoribosylaminopyrimidine deaminase/5-amino-6-(5-phosphoribosylamino)uracil reductase
MEPCAHHGRTPPCVDAIVAAGIARVVAGCSDPSPEAGGGAAALRRAGVDVEVLELRDARLQNEAWRTWVSRGRPYVVLKLAVSVDGRAVVPGRRWVTGEAARRRVHELRAEVDAVAVGMGTVLADAPRLDARDVGAARQPRRLAFGRGPLPEESELELRSGPLDEELAALAGEGVQSLLLEGGPTIATSFVAAGLVDRLLVFVAPVLAGVGPRMLGPLPEPIVLPAPTIERIDDDVLLDVRLREA